MPTNFKEFITSVNQWCPDPVLQGGRTSGRTENPAGLWSDSDRLQRFSWTDATEGESSIPNDTGRFLLVSLILCCLCIH